MEFDGLSEVVRSRFEHVEIKTDPFPYFYIEDFLPQDFYIKMRSMWPNDSEFIKITESGRVHVGTQDPQAPHPYSNRTIINLTEKALPISEDSKKEFWEGFRNWLLSKRFFDIVLGRLEEHLYIDYTESVKSGLVVDGLMVRDRKSYALGPHTDTPSKVFTLLYYCPESDVQPDIGTSIYTPINEKSLIASAKHFKRSDFDLHYTAPFKSNSLFGFVRTDNSYHGLEELGELVAPRDLIIYNVQLINPSTKIGNMEKEKQSQSKKADVEEGGSADIFREISKTLFSWLFKR